MSNTWHRFGKDDHSTPTIASPRNSSFSSYEDDDADTDEDFGSQHNVRPLRGAKIYENTRGKAHKPTRKNAR